VAIAEQRLRHGRSLEPLDVYERLFEEYGPQHWWPADSPFEVMIGAVLTQNTAWVNVERALGNLKRTEALDAEALLSLPMARLAELLRPSGFFNLKARRVVALCRWYLDNGDLKTLRRRSTARLRNELLAVHGIGRETADDILLYVFERPVFVVDAYTRRLLSRLGLLDGEQGYESIRAQLEAALPRRAPLFNEFHALIVQHGKGVCRVKPRCDKCCFAADCPARSRQRI
jgi:endonuclease-3 related protein